MRKTWFLVLFAAILLSLPVTGEAQQVIIINGVSYVPAPNYGIPAAPGPIPNGSIRHYYNGYVGVNARHYSRVPMKWGTGPVMHTGPIVMYPPCGRYPVPYRRGYVGGAYGPGGGYIGGGYAGNGWYIQGGISIR